ncbi:MAG: STAS domain-containing protein [Kofleriaceae bacterium]
MTQKFQAAIQHRGDVSYVKLGGVIDEDNELSGLVERIPTGTAVIDLGEIERINSCGVRDWVNWLSRLETNGTRSVLVECSPAIVAQINLVNNFTGSGVVKSFYVPYFCSECDEEKVLLVEAADMGPPPHEPPTCRCDECDLVMDFDDMPDSYFAFLSNQKKIGDAIAAGAVRELERTDDAGGTKVRSRTSQPNLGGVKGSVPSLSGVQRTPAQGAVGSGPIGPKTRTQPGANGNTSTSAVTSNSRPPGSLGARIASNPGPSHPRLSAGGIVASTVVPPRSNAVVYVLVALLAAALVVLAFLVFKS